MQVLIGQPFDLLKVRQQTSSNNISLVNLFKTTLKTEGITAFYKGTLPPLLGVGACVSIQFYAFHETKRQLQTYNKKLGFDGGLSLPQYYIAGAAAGIANSVITGPVEQLRIIIQTQPSGKDRLYDGPRDAFRTISQSHGWGSKGIFRGFGITLLREAQAYGMWFLAFEYLVNKAQQSTNKTRNEIPAWQLAAFGALSGEILWLSSYPLDVVKSRVQSDGFGDKRKYRNWIDAMKQTIAESGARGLWRGIVPTLLRALPASAGTFMSVELALRVMG